MPTIADLRTFAVGTGHSSAPVVNKHLMKIKYFQQTDTLYIEFRQCEVAETRDLDENTLLELDRSGNICAITVEHARERADVPHFSYEQVAD